MAKVKVVSAYCDLNLTLRPSTDFHVLGERLERACAGRIRVFKDFRFKNCWAWQEFGDIYKPAHPWCPEDRFVSWDECYRWTLLQHSPCQWVWDAYLEDPSADVYVWIGYSIMKQGGFTGKPVQEHHITEFLDRLEKYPFDYIPFPGITPKGPVLPRGNNWRFVGSTIIFPAKFLTAIVCAYKQACREFVRVHRAVPIDLAIWPTVEEESGLPWRFYQGEYDATQFTGLQELLHD